MSTYTEGMYPPQCTAYMSTYTEAAYYLRYQLSVLISKEINHTILRSRVIMGMSSLKY